ncbi:hypothetical protein KEM48_008605 [Puccinia striiformis f. sp. tritici PST-130]|nr:hypothetical protein KEM48_008605 [Puccinia striiformis f. sp. tritici PST-130]
MEEWVSRNHKQLSEAYANNGIDLISELDENLPGRTSFLPSSTELSNHRPRETSVPIPADFLPDPCKEAKKRRIGQHMDSPLLHRQKTSSPTNNHILGKASESMGGSSANMDDSTTYATEQAMGPYSEPWNLKNAHMGSSADDYFNFSDYGAHLSLYCKWISQDVNLATFYRSAELSSHPHTAHNNLATNGQMIPLPTAGGTRMIDELGHMGDKIALQKKLIICKEAPQSSQATRVNPQLNSDPVWPRVASFIGTSDGRSTHDMIDDRTVQNPLDVMFPLSMGAQINPDFFEIYKALSVDSGAHPIESTGNKAITSTSDTSIIGDHINRSDPSSIHITSNKIPQESNISKTIHQRKSHNNLQSSPHLKSKKGLFVPNFTSSTSLHTKGSDVHSNLSQNSIDSSIYKVRPNELVMGGENLVINNLEPQEASKNDDVSLVSSGKTGNFHIPRLIFNMSTMNCANISPNYEGSMSKILNLVKTLCEKNTQINWYTTNKLISGTFTGSDGDPNRPSAIERNSLWLQSKKVLFENVSTWLKYWNHQTGYNLEEFSTKNWPPELQKIFPLFVLYAEMIITVLGDPNEDHLEYVKKLKRAMDFFKELVEHDSSGNLEEDSKVKVREMKAFLLENIKKKRAPRSEFLWHILKFWITEEHHNLWTNEKIGQLSVNDHFKGLFNSIFSFSIENLTKFYKSRIP